MYTLQAATKTNLQTLNKAVQYWHDNTTSPATFINIIAEKKLRMHEANYYCA